MKKHEDMIRDVRRRIGEYEAERKSRRARNARIAAAAVPVCAAAVCVGLWRAGAFEPKAEKTVAGAETTAPATERATSGAELIATEPAEKATEGKKELRYSELVGNTAAPELEGYDGTGAALDISGFKDSEVKEYAVGVVEGEILDVWVNRYEYATASDKFEPGGRLYHKPSTVAYKIRVDKVYGGDFSAGDEITVEDQYFVLDSVVSIKKGGTYVIPIGEGGGVLDETSEVVEGSNVMESRYYTEYQFHPQIEKVEGGYVVPGDWETLITDEATEVVMDVGDPDNIFYGKTYFVPDEVFDERMAIVLQN